MKIKSLKKLLENGPKDWEKTIEYLDEMVYRLRSPCPDRSILDGEEK
jgi:hypothetical protein